MGHFAEIDENGEVLRVIVVNNNVLVNSEGKEDESLGIQFCKTLYGENTNWVQASYSGSKRGVYPGKGFKYDFENDTFIAPIPPEPPKDVKVWEIQGETVEKTSTDAP